MHCLFALVVVALFVAATAHVSDLETGLRPIRSCDDSATDNRFYSYHIHVLYWQNSENSTAMAMDVRQRFMDEFRVRNECTVGAGDTAPQQHTICYFTPDTGPAGPFVTAQYSFFIPKGYYRVGDTFAWIMQNRGTLDSFVHPNSGCATKDHTEWSLWGGNKWELDASIFHS